MSRLSSRIIDAFALCLPKTECSRAAPRVDLRARGERIAGERTATATSRCTCSQPCPLRVQTFRITYISAHCRSFNHHCHIHSHPSLVRSFVKGDCLLPLCSFPPLIRRRLVRNSHLIYVP